MCVYVLLYMTVMLRVDEVNELDDLQYANYRQQSSYLLAVYVHLIVDDDIVVDVACRINCLRFFRRLTGPHVGLLRSKLLLN